MRYFFFFLDFWGMRTHTHTHTHTMAEGRGQTSSFMQAVTGMTGWDHTGPPATVTVACVRWTHVPVQPQFLGGRQPGAIELQPGLVHATSLPETHGNRQEAADGWGYSGLFTGGDLVSYWRETPTRTHAGRMRTSECNGRRSKRRRGQLDTLYRLHVQIRDAWHYQHLHWYNEPVRWCCDYAHVTKYQHFSYAQRVCAFSKPLYFTSTSVSGRPWREWKWENEKENISDRWPAKDLIVCIS